MSGKLSFNQMDGCGSFVADNLLEDLEELGLGDLAIGVLVDGSDELVNLGLLDLPVLAHVLESIVDQLGDLVGLQGSALVGVIGIENGIDGVLEVLVTIAHVFVLEINTNIQ